MRARNLMPELIDWEPRADRSGWAYDNPTVGQFLMPVLIQHLELTPEYVTLLGSYLY